MEINTPGEIMSDISMIGLGAMGGALARALQNGGRDITVWNRSAEKMEALVANGAAGASSVGGGGSCSSPRWPNIDTA